MSNRDVFINCPFSADYRHHFLAIVFATIRSGFEPRCALENDDGGEIRFEKICRIISQCRYGIHDISKTEPDPESNLPRFNMPLELGLFLGATRFGSKVQKEKKVLILDREQFRYQRFISDIAGQDIKSHKGEVDQLIQRVATWFRDDVGPNMDGVTPPIPGGRAIASEFSSFQATLPAFAAAKRLDVDELTFRDLLVIMPAWIVETSGA